MTAPKHAVKVTIGSEEFTVRSDHDPAYTREVAAHFDRQFREIRAAAPALELHKAAILAGLAVTDELFQARTGDAAQAERLAKLCEQVARLLPPAKRGARAPSSP